MKKTIATTVALFGCCLAAFGGGSDKWTDAQGVEWVFNWSGSGSDYTATITDCNMPIMYDMAIPATVYMDGGSTPCKVTQIGSYAFYKCSALESVVIPASVTAIANYAFYSGSGSSLRFVTFKGKVPGGCNITLAFYGTPFLGDCKVSNWFDDFVNSYPIVGASGSLTSDNYLATLESDDPLKKESSFAMYTKWFEWTAPKSGTAWFHTQGSKFDTLLGVYQGASLASLAKVASNDDFMADRTSQVSFSAEVGQTYRICVGGYYTSGHGEFKLAWRMGTPVVLTLDPNGGTLNSALSSVLVPKNAAVGGLPTPSKTDYTMSAWYTAKTGGTKVTAKTKFAKNAKLFARWGKTKFKVLIASGAGGTKVTGSGSYAWGSKVKLTAKPKSGYVFWYWQPDDTASQTAFAKYDTLWRKDSVQLTTPKNDIRYKAFFVQKSADAISMSVPGAVELFAEDGGNPSTDVIVTSVSYPTVKASGVPAGVKFKSVSGTDNCYRITISNDALVPPGRHVVKVTAKNRSGKTATKSVVVWGRNNVLAANAGLITLPNQLVHSPSIMNVGITPDWSSYGIAAQSGYKISKIDGMPSGLAWDSKHQKITGFPSKSGVYTFVITIKKGSKKHQVTTTFRVNALPDHVVGTFRGYTTVGGSSFGEGSRMVTVTVAKDGTMSASSGDYKMTGAGLEYSAGYSYIVNLDGSYKDKKKNEYIRRIHLQIYDPAKPYYERAAFGDLTHGTKKKGGVADTSNDLLYLRKNAFGRKADGTALVSEKAQSVLEYVAYYQDNATVTASTGEFVSLKFNKDANGRLNGFLTLSGDLGSGSAMLFYEGMSSTFRYLVARFRIGTRAVEVRYEMYFNGTSESASIKSTKTPTVTVWSE